MSRVYFAIALLILPGCVQPDGTTIQSATQPTAEPTPIATISPDPAPAIIPDPQPTITPSPSPSPSPTLTCAPLSHDAPYGIYSAVIYSHADAGFPSVQDTITVFIPMNHNYDSQLNFPGAFSLYPNSHTFQGYSRYFPDLSQVGSLNCDYDELGNAHNSNSYCPQKLTITQPDTLCPTETVVITGNFQAVFPNSPVPIESTQTFTLTGPQ